MSIYVDIKFVRLISSRLRNFKQKKADLFSFSCPFCGDSKKNPLKARGFVYKKNGSFFYKCHNCPTSTNVAGLIERVDPSLYKEYVLEKYINEKPNIIPKNVKKFNILPPKFGKVKKENSYIYAEWCLNLPQNHSCLTYIRNRRLPFDFYDKLLYTENYRKFIGEAFPYISEEDLNKIYEDKRLVIPFYNEYNEIIAFSGRSLSLDKNTLRYVTVRGKDSREKLIYGMDRINLHRKVKILEGEFDSMFLSNTLASSDANLISVAKEVSAKDMILVFDNENRNKEIIRTMEKAIQQNFKIVIWPDNIHCKDINEMILIGMKSSDVEDIISKNTFTGIMAKMRLSTWRRV